MSTSRNHENQIDNYLSQVEIGLNIVRDDERTDILNEIREVLQAKRLEAGDAEFSPIEALGDPALFANQWLEAAGYTSQLPSTVQGRSKNILYLSLLIVAALALPFRTWPTISNFIFNFLHRVPVFGFSVLFLYACLIVIFILRALGKSMTDVLMSFSTRLKSSISRSSTGTHFLNSFDQIKPVWWVLRAWTLAILISYQRDPVREKHFYPIPSWDGRRSVGLLLFIALGVGSFIIGNHSKVTKGNFWYLPLLVSNVVLIALFSMIAFTHADYNNTKREVAIPILPTCDTTFALLPQPGGRSELNGRIPKAAPGPMRLCRYRWNESEKKLVLIADIELPLAPTELMQSLPQLKTVIDVYGPNFLASCPAGQGSIDLVIIRSATSSKMTILEAQRDGCSLVIATHDNFLTYISYLHSSKLDAQFDAITAPVNMQTTKFPTIRLTPHTNFHDGQQVLVQIIGASPNERFRISECATSAYVNVYGCGDQPAMQPFIDTDPSGAGSTLFYVHAKAATKPVSTVFLPCTVHCVIMATGANISGLSTFVYAPLAFSK